MSMKRGTTPTITITVDGLTFEGITVYITLEDSAGTQITKDSAHTGVTKTVIYDSEGEGIGCKIAVNLSQEETLSLQNGAAQVQLTWIDANGIVDKSDIGKVKFDRTLLEQTVTYGG